jgi:PAS domain S-box-containing protein
MAMAADSQVTACLALTRAISRSRTVEEFYEAALDALATGLGVDRSSILLFDHDGVMRFKASRGLSAAYRRAVEGHTLWKPDTPDPQSVAVADVRQESSLAPFWPVLEADGIVGMTFIPLVNADRVIGKCMLYHATPRTLDVDELALASLVAAQIAFAVERTRTADQARRSEERLRFVLDATSMGIWDWDLTTNRVQWSDNLERIHGLAPGTFDGTFASYEREIHPEDRDRVLASAQRALSEGVPHDVEYRIVAPDGSVRWCEGKGQVEYQDGRPVRMTGVCMMVTPRKEAELERLAAAEESSRLKDEFLATLSHELRTPLNAILGWAHMLEGGLSPDKTRRAIDVIGRNARLQAQLIEDVLDVSRIIVGKLDVERIPLSVPQLVDAVVADESPAFSAKRIRFEKRIDAEVGSIEGDPRRLHQVLSNVLSNAVKFTPEGGSIALDCSARPASIEIQIRDSGEGIASEFLPFVFDRFRQADSRTTRKHGGLGLGLAIARHLVEQHGGSICTESDGPGLGTTVTIRLPATSPVWWASTLGALPEPSAEETRLDDVTILVVDDQPDSREVVARLLEQRGARVQQCDCAASALEILDSEAPVHLLIADIAMPDIDGYELIRRIRASGSELPAIAVTAIVRPSDRERALASGYAAYCPKPVDGASLAQVARCVVSASGC